ncbi:hypothetical protein Curi_c18710 [Gottschalkia acidurici 9a]|uniref:ABC transporter permease protein n=1 Tax=Gottschalkia acidurici (strain ATCC 7906 / DSM 604 / BCRC 14475 / CIP 104303 / KCTC 5404 / NCIMB 10678 / 9a) TaxID=1128398 RepID=K0B1D1_GOTA9|nr:hypothetical protein [Gottschalkia acidurici]AFS78877.1 hypothetical protein Curi_c18710 [Gottschalkia acidurici 9a]
MKINKALVKHEWRTMKWMLIYFTLVSIGYIVMFNLGIRYSYISMLKYGTSVDGNIIIDILRGINEVISIPFGIGIVLMIVMQFKDSKSLEVGRFLKSLPISSREYYLTKIISGIMSYTLPFIILVIGVLAIRTNNMEWINDSKNISIVPDIFIKLDSTTNVFTLLILVYSIVTATYTFLFMVQYLVMNTIGGIVIGILSWLSPMFILFSVEYIYGNYIFKSLGASYKILEYIQPWIYHINARYSQVAPLITDLEKYQGTAYVYVFEGILIKIAICAIVALASVLLAYFLTKKSRIEDSDTMITFKGAKKIFIIGVTVCSALLGGTLLKIFFDNFTDVNFITQHILMIITGSIGFIISRKISNIGVR